MPDTAKTARDLVRTSNQCNLPFIPMLTTQEKKNDAAKRITDFLAETYKPNSGTAGIVRKALASKLTLPELSGLLAMVWTTSSVRKD